MSTKPITIFASMIAVFATLTTAQAAPKTGMNHPAINQDASFQVAQSIWEPRRPPVVCVGCARGRG